MMARYMQIAGNSRCTVGQYGGGRSDPWTRPRSGARLQLDVFVGILHWPWALGQLMSVPKSLARSSTPWRSHPSINTSLSFVRNSTTDVRS